MPGNCGAPAAMGVAKGLSEIKGCAGIATDLSDVVVAGAGPGMDGGEEKSGRASSMNENVGTAEESTAPNAPGMAGAGGWAG